MALMLLAFSVPALAFNCKVTATGLAFSGYDVFSTIPVDTMASLLVSCNVPPPLGAVPVTISLSPGGSGSFAQRQMRSASGTALNYNLYTSASFSSIWGDGGGGSEVLTNFLTRDTPWTATIYGRIPARQNVSADAYSDTIVVTIEW
jgi:spore coat protein U-like protein